MMNQSDEEQDNCRTNSRSLANNINQDRQNSFHGSSERKFTETRSLRTSRTREELGMQLLTDEFKKRQDKEKNLLCDPVRTQNQNNPQQTIPSTFIYQSQSYKNVDLIVQTQIEQKSVFSSKEISKLNILLLGKRRLGKTAFIDYLGGEKQQKAFNQMQYRSLKSKQGQLTFIDMKGYTYRTIDQYTKTISQFLVDTLTRHSFDEKPDQRIHCCLFFLNGIDEFDSIVIDKIAKYVNIIPIILKKKQYTQRNIDNIITHIQQLQQKNSFKWFMGSKNVPIQQFISQEIYGKVLPFVLMSDPFQKCLIGDCSIGNCKHKDYFLFKKLIVSQYKDQLIRLTNIIKRKIRLQQKIAINQKMIELPNRKKQKQLLFSYFAFGIPSMALLYITGVAFSKRF